MEDDISVFYLCFAMIAFDLFFVNVIFAVVCFIVVIFPLINNFYYYIEINQFCYFTCFSACLAYLAICVNFHFVFIRRPLKRIKIVENMLPTEQLRNKILSGERLMCLIINKKQLTGHLALMSKYRLHFFF